MALLSPDRNTENIIDQYHQSKLQSRHQKCPIFPTTKVFLTISRNQFEAVLHKYRPLRYMTVHVTLHYLLIGSAVAGSRCCCMWNSSRILTEGERSLATTSRIGVDLGDTHFLSLAFRAILDGLSSFSTMYTNYLLRSNAN